MYAIEMCTSTTLRGQHIRTGILRDENRKNAQYIARTQVSSLELHPRPRRRWIFQGSEWADRAPPVPEAVQKSGGGQGPRHYLSPDSLEVLMKHRTEPCTKRPQGRDGKRRRYGVMRVKEREIKQTDREINKMGKREMRPMTQDTVLFV